MQKPHVLLALEETTPSRVINLLKSRARSSKPCNATKGTNAKLSYPIAINPSYTIALVVPCRSSGVGCKVHLPTTSPQRRNKQVCENLQDLSVAISARVRMVKSDRAEFRDLDGALPIRISIISMSFTNMTRCVYRSFLGG